MTPFSVHPPPAEVVDLGEGGRSPDAATDAVIQSVWEEEKARRGDALFNGRLFSVEEMGGGRIAGRFVEYRRYLAQRRRPELFGRLGVRPLSVSGLLRVGGAAVFGRRSLDVSEEPGCWELVPSGGVDAGARRADGRIDLEGQIAAELREEVGLPGSALSRVRPFCVVDDAVSRVVTVGLELETDWDEAAVRSAHRAGSTGEYLELEFVPPGRLAGFLAANAGRLVAVSAVFLEEIGGRDQPVR